MPRRIGHPQLVRRGGRATGVDYAVGHEARQAKAEVEIVLAAGAIGSPHFLLLSGIGPADEITAHGIQPVLDLPGVGRCLRDHVARRAIDIAVKDPEALGLGDAMPDRAAAEAQFSADRTGPLATMQIEAGAFVRTRETDEYPNAQLFCGVSNAERFWGLTPGLSVWGYVCRPRIEGTVKLATGSSFDRPLIDPNYFEDPDDLDRSVEIVELCQKIAHHSAFEDVRLAVSFVGSNRLL